MNDTSTGTSSVDALLEEAFSVSGALPSPERRTELYTQLRAEAERLMSAVEDIARGTNHGTREWYAMDSALAYTRDVLAETPGDGPLASSLLTRDVARQIHALRKYAEGPS